MSLRILSIIFFAVFLLQTPVTAQKPNENQVEFTVPAAPWTLKLDGRNFTIRQQQIKPDGKYGYFLMSNDKDRITASLFIEPVEKCKTSEECRDMVYRLGNPAWGELQNVVQSKIGDISYFEFFRPTVQGQPVQMLDMYAEFVQDGFWVDLHISKVLYKKEDHVLFENLVKSAKFESKPDKLKPNGSNSTEAAQKILELWMPLWDAGDYDAAYAELAEHTKKSIDKRTWFVYWTAARKPLGKVKSRKLVSAEYVKSLEGAPDQSGAIFQYKSLFENREAVLETFGMMLEKDGAWRVANYLTD